MVVMVAAAVVVTARVLVEMMVVMVVVVREARGPACGLPLLCWSGMCPDYSPASLKKSPWSVEGSASVGPRGLGRCLGWLRVLYRDSVGPGPDSPSAWGTSGQSSTSLLTSTQAGMSQAHSRTQLLLGTPVPSAR